MSRGAVSNLLKILFIMLLNIFNLSVSASENYSSAQIEKGQNSESRELVVLLHGLARGSNSMSRLEKALKEEGYLVLNLDYPSRKYRFEYLADKYLHTSLLENNANKASKLHFIGHSMGGILARYYISKYRPENLGRVVTLGTPNRGSELADMVNNYSLIRKIFGSSLEQLSPQSRFMQNLSNEVDYELGVIAGNFSLNPINSLLIVPGADDGTVSVESTKIEGMKEHKVVKAAHVSLSKNIDAISSAVRFIKYGSFYSGSAGTKNY